MIAVWSRQASEEVDEASAYIARDRSAAADAWLDGLQAAVARLCDYPLGGHVFELLDDPDIREMRYSSYRIIYRVQPRRIVVLRVVHGRRLLKPEDFGMKR